jgi:SAM-dependent methyltransferase
VPPPRVDYERHGPGYARHRRSDPRIAARIHAALGDARTVLNVGAGAGSYEPDDRWVLAVEPSAAMRAQRPPGAAPAIDARAEALPFDDDAVDAAMACVTIHHWEPPEAGLRELRRVARGPVVILTYDPLVSGEMWLMADYLVEVAALDRRIFPAPELLAAWLGGDVGIEPVPIPRACTDWMLGSFWAHPERVLDPRARAATSGFARMRAEVVDRVVRDVGRDLGDGTWDRRHGRLRELSELDVGLRLVVARP